MGYAELLSITKTYRNSQEVIDIAGNFIQKNSSQIRKSLKSPKTITDPVIIYTYDSKLKDKGASARSGAIYNQAKAVEIAIEQILEYDKQSEKKSSSILLLGRFGFDGKNLERSGLFEYKDSSKVKCLKYPKLNITFMTAHASKGLGYDNVIVINGKNEEQNLVQVKERIQIIVKYDNRSCKRFFKFLRSKIDDEFIYTIDPLFFCEIKTFLEKRNYMDYLNYIYAKYKKRIS